MRDFTHLIDEWAKDEKCHAPIADIARSIRKHANNPDYILHALEVIKHAILQHEADRAKIMQIISRDIEKRASRDSRYDARV